MSVTKRVSRFGFSNKHTIDFKRVRPQEITVHGWAEYTLDVNGVPAPEATGIKVSGNVSLNATHCETEEKIKEAIERKLSADGASVVFGEHPPEIA